MALRIDPTVLTEMRASGPSTLTPASTAATVPRSVRSPKTATPFPRRMIRYAQLGQKHHVVASKELWLCYYCAECSDTCPRQADPGEFMASARRYAIARFDPTTFSRRFYRSKAFAATAVVALFVVFLAVLLAGSPGLPSGRTTRTFSSSYLSRSSTGWAWESSWPWRGGRRHPDQHVLDDVSGSIAGRSWGSARPARAIPAQGRPGGRKVDSWGNIRPTTLPRLREGQAGAPPILPLRRWFVHYSIMMGMIGLAVATALDYAFKTPGSYVPVWYPIRLLGTIAGIFLVYGASVVIVQRLRKSDTYHSYTPPADWVFILLLWLVGASGFILEIADYAPIGSTWVDIVFLVHIVLAMELILLLPFTKFAHIVYRPAAIWFTEFRRLRAAQVK